MIPRPFTCSRICLSHISFFIDFYINKSNISVINFLILAIVVFFIVKGLNKLTELGKKKEEEVVEEPAAPAEPEPTKEELLLTEIRDLLKEK